MVATSAGGVGGQSTGNVMCVARAMTNQMSAAPGSSGVISGTQQQQQTVSAVSQPMSVSAYQGLVTAGAAMAGQRVVTVSTATLKGSSPNVRKLQVRR